MFRRILVAFDGSPDANAALRKAAELAGTEGELEIFSVAPHPTSWIAGGTLTPPYDSTQLQSDIDDSWEAQLRDAEATVPDQLRERTEVRLGHGSPGPSIIDELSRERFDLIVLGTQGHSAVGALLLGSVSLHVIHASPVPVLIVRADQPETQD
jgi:nucleotide-binding universal stress UspA family protein